MDIYFYFYFKGIGHKKVGFTFFSFFIFINKHMESTFLPHLPYVSKTYLCQINFIIYQIAPFYYYAFTLAKYHLFIVLCFNRIQTPKITRNIYVNRILCFLTKNTFSSVFKIKSEIKTFYFI